MKLYSELAHCWDVLTPRGTYDLEAVKLLEVLNGQEAILSAPSSSSSLPK